MRHIVSAVLFSVVATVAMASGDPGATQGVAPNGQGFHSPMPASWMSAPTYSLTHGTSTFTVTYGQTLGTATFNFYEAPFQPRNSEGIWYAEAWLEWSDDGGSQWWFSNSLYTGLWQINTGAGGTSAPFSTSWNVTDAHAGRMYRVFGNVYMWNQGGSQQGLYPLYSNTSAITYSPPQYTVTTATAGAGGGSVSGGGSYQGGTQVTLTASPDGNSLFDHWEGDLTGQVASQTITVDSNKSVTAWFAVKPPANRAPTVALTVPAGAVSNGAAYTVSAAAHDPDSNLSSVSITKNGVPFASAGAGNTLDSSASGTTSDSGPATITYVATASDDQGFTATDTKTVAIQAPNLPPAVTASISADNTHVTQPGSATVTWTSANATSVSVTGSGGFSSNIASGTLPLSNLSAGSYTYSITAQGQNGPVSQSVTITVDPPPNVTSAWINANPGSGMTPLFTTITWGSTNADTVSVSTTAYGGAVLSTDLSGSQGCSNLTTGSYTFSITASGPTGSVTKTVTVSVTSNPSQPSGRNNAMNANPNPVPWSGGSVTFSGDSNIGGPGVIKIYKKHYSYTQVYWYTDDDGVDQYYTQTNITYEYFDQLSIYTPGGTGAYWGSYSFPAATDSNPVYYYCEERGTDQYGGGCAADITVNGIPPPQQQTVTITPSTISASPGDTITLTASGSHTSYVWVGTTTSNANTATFTVPLTAKLGDSFTINCYAPAGGPIGSNWAQSAYAVATISMGVNSNNGYFNIWAMAQPANLPWTGGTETAYGSVQLSHDPGGGTVYTATYAYAPNYVDLGSLGSWSVAPTPAPVVAKTFNVGMNLSATKKTYSVTVTGSGAGFASTGAQVNFTQDPVPANAAPIVSMSSAPTIYWDGNYVSWGVGSGGWGPDSLNVVGYWEYQIYSPGAQAQVTAQVIWSNGTTYSPQFRGANAAGYNNTWSPYGTSWWTQANVMMNGDGMLGNISNPPMGTYKLRMTATSSNGTTVKEVQGVVVQKAIVYATFDAPPNGTETVTDPDTGEESTNDLYPSDYGWSINPNYVTCAVGDTVPMTLSTGGGYKFVRWRDQNGNTLGYNLTLNANATQLNYNYIYAVLVPDSTGGTPVTFSASPLSFAWDGTAKAPTITSSVAGIAYNKSGTSSAANVGTYTFTVSADSAHTIYAGSNTFTWTITPKPITFSFSNMTQLYDGTPKSAGVIPSDPSATFTVSYQGSGTTSYGPSATAPSAAGTYTVTATATGNYSGTGSGTLTIGVPVTFTFSNLTQTYDGSPKSATVTPSINGATFTTTYSGSGATTYGPSSTPPTNAGTYIVKATATGGYTGISSDNFTITKANPALTWGPPAAITYGTALSSAQLNASANVLGTFVYTPAAGTVLGVGITTLQVSFTPFDTANWSAATSSVSIAVNKATPVITWNPPAAITYGTALSGTQLNATANVPGSFSYLPAAGTVLGAGPQTLLATFTPTDSTNYATASATVALTVNQAPATVTLGGLSQTYDGTAKAATATTGPAGLGVTITYNGSTTVPTAAGTYTVVATVNDPNYTGSATGTLVIAKATPAVSWATPAAITYGTALSGTQLNATATVPGSFVYSPAAGAVLGAGSQTLSVTFNPTDSTNYNSVNASVTLTVNKAAATVTLSNLAQTYTGTPRTATATTAPAGLGVSLTYNGSGTAPTNAGSYAVVATITDANYTGSTSGTLVVAKVTPTITWPAPAAITYGTALSATQLNASASVPGTFVYSPTSGTVLPAGSQTLSVTFTPTDSTNYNGAASSVTLTVNKATAVVSLSNLAQTYNGTPRSATATTTPAGLGVTLTYNGSGTAPTNAGSYTVVGTVSDPNYVGTASNTLVIAKATPTITWATPAAITYGTALSATQLNASASVPGSFAYSPAAGAVLGAGTQSLSTTFTPTDTSNYNSASGSVSLTVNKATATVTLGNLIQTYNGTPRIATASTTPGGLSVSLTYNGSGTAPTNAGSYTVVGTITDANYSGSATGTLLVGKATPTITWGNPAAITYGTALGATQLNATASTPGSFVYSPAAGTVLTVGTQTLNTTFTPTDTTNWNGGSASVTIVVNKATATITLGNLTQTYDGTPKSASATTTPAGLSVSLTYNLSSTPPTNAGSYNVVGTINDANYQGSASGTLTINPATVTFTFSPTTFTYTGSPQGPTTTATPSNATYSVSYTGILGTSYGPSATMPANAGTYSVTATAAGNYTGTGSATFTIGPAAQTVTISPTSQNVLQGGSITFTASGGMNAYSWGGFGASGSGSSKTVSFPNTGTYQVTVQSAAGGNYAASNVATASITVLAPVSLTLTASPSQGEPPLTTTITWSTTNATTASVSGPSLTSTALSGSQSVTLPEGTQTYVLTASNSVSSDTQTLIIPVQRAPMTLTVTMSDSNGGSVSGSGVYLRGDYAYPIVTVGAHYYFTGWTGSITGMSLAPTVVMDTNKTAVANVKAKTPDVITFANPGQQQIRPIGTPKNVQLIASDLSGQTIVFQVVSGPASVSGSMLTLSGQLGTVTVQAMQPVETATMMPATAVSQTFDVVLMPPAETTTKTDNSTDTINQNTSGQGYILAPKK